MLTLPPDRDLDAERLDLYDRMTRGITVALDVYADAALARRSPAPDLADLDGPPPSWTFDVDTVLGLAVDLLRGAGDEPLAWLIVEAMALRGGPPAKVMDAIVALHTLHQGPPPPLVETARRAVRAGAAAKPARPTIEPMRPWADRGRG